MASHGKEDALPPPGSNQQSAITVDALEKLLDRRFAMLATAEQISEMGGRISKNEAAIRDIQSSLGLINDKIRSQSQISHSVHKSPPNRPPHLRIGPGRELSYHLSRKSVRMSPISGNNNEEMITAVNDFIGSALKIPDFEAHGLAIEHVRRMRTSPKSASYLEVCVTFSSIDDRDFVASKAINLAPLVDDSGKPMAGIRMDVPGHLMPTNNDLKNYAYQARRTHGKGTKTDIKFDDFKRNLYLKIKLPHSKNWLRTLPERARELISSNTSHEIQELQSTLRLRSSGDPSSFRPALSSLSSSGSSASSSILSGGNSQPLALPNTQLWRPPKRDQYPDLGFGNA